MARLETYNFDLELDGQEYLLGTDDSNAKKTRSYPLNKIADYIANRIEEGGNGGTGNADGTFTWVMYAEDIEGTNMSPVKVATSNFVGYGFNKTLKTPSTNPQDYIWMPITLVKGRDGVDGANGIDGLDGSTGIKGIPGLNGAFTYFHIAYADNLNGGGFSQHPYNKKFIGTYSDYMIADSNVPTDYEWISVVGLDGTKGIPGVNAVDGLTYYVHIAYANSADGITGFDLVESLDKQFIGTLVDLIEADSITPSDYNWSRILNPNIGIDDGNGTFTWIKYTFYPDGNNPLSDSDNNMRYVGFAYRKATAIESLNVFDYEWSLIYVSLITKTSQLINDGDGIDKYVRFIDLLKNSPAVENSYTNIAGLLAGQSSQTKNYIQYVADATGDPSVDPDGIIYRFYNYLGTTLGTIADYVELTVDQVAEEAVKTKTSQFINDGENGIDKFISEDTIGDFLPIPTQDSTNKLILGTIVWTGTGYNYLVTVTRYYMNGVLRDGLLKRVVTLDPSDATLDRIDTFIIRNNGLGDTIANDSIEKLTGVPSDPLIERTVNEDSELKLGVAIVTANTVEPENTNVEHVYIDGAEWLISVQNNSSGSINYWNTVSPISGVKDIEFSTPPQSSIIYFTHPTEAKFVTSTKFLVFDIKLNNIWEYTTRDTKTIDIYLGTGIADYQIFTDRLRFGEANGFGFSLTNITDVQTVVVPFSRFSGINNSNTFRTIKFVTKQLHNKTFHIDNIRVVDGVDPVAISQITRTSQIANDGAKADDGKSFIEANLTSPIVGDIAVWAGTEFIIQQIQIGGGNADNL